MRLPPGVGVVAFSGAPTRLELLDPNQIGLEQHAQGAEALNAVGGAVGVKGTS